jgi:hypothetical protein
MADEINKQFKRSTNGPGAVAEAFNPSRDLEDCSSRLAWASFMRPHLDK